MKLLMSWAISEMGDSSGGNHYVSDWCEVWAQLRRLKGGAGSVDLEITDAPDVAPFNMSVAADRGNYLVTLLETTEDDSDVRFYSNPMASAEMVEILGNDWDARHLTRDFDLVCNLFKEFFDTGDVSRQWLN